MANLELTFSDYYTKVSEYLGLGSSPTGTNLTLVKDLFHRAYRRFLFPLNAGTGKNYVWSFMTPEAKLVFTTDLWTYSLPADFGGIVRPFAYEDLSRIPLGQVSITALMNFRSGGDTSGTPTDFAIRSGVYAPNVGTTYEALFYPTPASVETLTYSYKVIPQKLENTTDVAMGGVATSECLLQMCLAAAELQEDGVASVQEAMAQTMLQSAIKNDIEISAADSLGYNGDDSDRRRNIGRDVSADIVNVTVNL